MSELLQIDIAWPDDLPLPFVDYSGNLRTSSIRSPLDFGGAIQHRARSKPVYPQISASWRLTADQYLALQDFFQGTLGNGAAAFSVGLRYPKNSELSTWLVRFVGGLSATWQEGLWAVSAALDLIVSAVIEDLATLIGYVNFEVPEEESSGTLYVPVQTVDGFILQVQE